MGLLRGLMPLLLLVHGGMSRLTDCNNDIEICQIANNVVKGGTKDFSTDAVTRLSCAFKSKNVVIYTDPANTAVSGSVNAGFDEGKAQGAEGYNFNYEHSTYHIWVFDSGTMHPGEERSPVGHLAYFPKPPPAQEGGNRKGQALEFGKRQPDQQQQCSSQTGESTTRSMTSSTATNSKPTSKRRSSKSATATQSQQSADTETAVSTTSAAPLDTANSTPGPTTAVGKTSSSRAGALGALPLPSAAAVAVGLAALWL